MSTPVRIVEPLTRSGELIVAPLSYDETAFNDMDVIDTAYNFFSPKSLKQFVITGVIAFADKDISDADDTVIIVYEAGDTTTITVDKVLLQFGMGKLTTTAFVPLRILVNAGKFVNAKTGDDDVHMTLMGYYIEAL